MTRRPHLLATNLDPEELAPLVEAAAQVGLRVGWLELAEAEPPAPLAAAADLGVLRAVAVGERGSVTVKPRHGPPVLDDLLREHFQGCALVLVRGEVDATRLSSAGADWIVEASAVRRRYDTAALARALRRPRPFG